MHGQIMNLLAVGIVVLGVVVDDFSVFFVVVS